MQQLTEEQRLEDYQKALAWFKESQLNNEGLCFRFGTIRWGNYMNSPFYGWISLKKYYPEFVGSEPYARLNYELEEEDARQEAVRLLRIDMLEQAILQLQLQSTADVPTN